jgi:hypothetical protein
MNDESNISPLNQLIGIWKGDKGMDIAPKPDEDENNPYYETLIIEPVDIDIENAEEQELLTVKYYQYVKEIETGDVSHSETGYWIWDKNEGTIMCAFVIPRGLSLLASGEFKISNQGALMINVSSSIDDPNWSFVQSPFLEKKAKTLAFTREFKVSGNTLTYTQETKLDIYGKLFNHTDTNTLIKEA